MSDVSADSVAPAGYRNSGKVGGQLKESGTSRWLSPNVGATNSSGFTALPGSIFMGGGNFWPIKTCSYFWSSTEVDATLGCERGIYNWGEGIGRYFDTKQYGFSVRCVKNP